MAILLILLLAYLESQGSLPPPSISYAASIIGAIAAGAAVVLTAMTQLRLARVDRKVDIVKKTGEATHQLSNSAMGAQLLTNVELLQELSVQAHRFAAVTKDAGDLAAAAAFDVKIDAAKKLYQEHVKNQAVIDATAAAEKC